MELGHYTVHPPPPSSPSPCLAARNALVVFVAALIGYCLTLQPWFDDQITLINYDQGTLPEVWVPNPTPDDCSVSNKIIMCLNLFGEF